MEKELSVEEFISMNEDRVEWEVNSASAARSFMLKHKKKFMEAGLMELKGSVYVFGKRKEDSGRELSRDEEFAQIDKDTENLICPEFDAKEREELIDAVLNTQRGFTESLVCTAEEKKELVNEYSYDEDVNPRAREVLSKMTDMELVAILRKAEVTGRKSNARVALETYAGLGKEA